MSVKLFITCSVWSGHGGKTVMGKNPGYTRKDGHPNAMQLWKERLEEIRCPSCGAKKLRYAPCEYCEGKK